MLNMSYNDFDRGEKIGRDVTRDNMKAKMRAENQSIRRMKYNFVESVYTNPTMDDEYDDEYGYDDYR